MSQPGCPQTSPGPTPGVTEAARCASRVTPGSNLSQVSQDCYFLPLFTTCTEDTTIPILQMCKLKLREADSHMLKPRLKLCSLSLSAHGLGGVT